MTKAELVDYIKRHIEKGHRPSAIKKILKRAGHDDGVIKDAFESALQTHPSATKKAKSKKEKIVVTITLALLGFLLITILLRIFPAYEFLERLRVEKPEMLPGNCRGLVDETSIHKCLLILSAEENTIEYCRFMPTFSTSSLCEEKIWESDYCLFRALTSEEGFDFEECKISEIRESQNLESCEYVDPMLKDKCYDDFAYTHLDEGLCRTDNCITAFAIAYNNLSSCARTGNLNALQKKEIITGKCIIFASLYYDNPFPCEYFERHSGLPKEVCLDYFNLPVFETFEYTDEYFAEEDEFELLPPELEDFEWVPGWIELRHGVSDNIFEGFPNLMLIEMNVEKILKIDPSLNRLVEEGMLGIVEGFDYMDEARLADELFYAELEELGWPEGEILPQDFYEGVEG